MPCILRQPRDNKQHHHEQAELSGFWKKDHISFFCIKHPIPLFFIIKITKYFKILVE